MNLRELDVFRRPSEDVRIAVGWMVPFRDVSEQFVTPPQTLRIIWEYLKRVGPLAVMRKIRSRQAERFRNQKSASIGFGIILEAPDASSLRIGERVLFVAPNHPNAPIRVVVDERLVKVVEHELSALPLMPSDERITSIAGWSYFSGGDLDVDSIQQGLVEIAKQCPVKNAGDPCVENVQTQPAICERIIDPAAKQSSLSAVIFGLGNYAKQIIIPNLPPSFYLAGIHEVDPDQLEGWNNPMYLVDTAPFLRHDENFDLWLVSGFHHTHTPIAIEALKRGSAVAIEKPLATTPDEFDQLIDAFRNANNPRLFACYQRRYAKYNQWLEEDIGIYGDAPVDYHCISYDISLSPLHWYCWKTSRSRMISNGCHWIDHFMSLNNYSPVKKLEATAGKGQNCLGWLQLENGAELTLALSETGGSPFGMRDHAEINVDGRTAVIRNGQDYIAFDNQRTIRKARINPQKCYNTMYRDIGDRVAQNQAGDSEESLRSASAAIALDCRLAQLAN